MIVDPKKTALVIDEQISRFMPVLPLFGLVIGYFLPEFMIQFRHWTPYCLALITLASALRLQIKEFGSAMRSPFPILVFFSIVRILMPLCVLLFSSLFFRGEPEIITGYIVIYSAPVAVAGFIWIVIFNGNKALGLSLILLDTLFSPLIMPATIMVLRGTDVNINASSIIVSMLLMVGIPTIVGVIINETSRGKIPAQISPFLNPLSKLSLIFIISSNSASILPTIQLNDLRIWKIAGLCCFFLISTMLLPRLGAFLIKCDHEKTVGLTFSAAQRNSSAALTVAVSFFPELVVLPTLVHIIFQQLLSGILGRLVFGKSRSDSS